MTAPVWSATSAVPLMRRFVTGVGPTTIESPESMSGTGPSRWISALQRSGSCMLVRWTSSTSTLLTRSPSWMSGTLTRSSIFLYQDVHICQMSVCIHLLAHKHFQLIAMIWIVASDFGLSLSLDRSLSQVYHLLLALGGYCIVQLTLIAFVLESSKVR